MKKQAILYKRVSTGEQNTARQEAIKIGLKVYEDKVSGSVPFASRNYGSQIVDEIKEGLISEIHVHSIDRLGRNTLDILTTIQFMTENGVNVISNKEGLRTLNDDGSENMVTKMMIGILGTLAQFERERMKERQKEGIVKAKQRGQYKDNGRPTGSGEDLDTFFKKPKVKKILRELKRGRSLRETALVSECSLGLVQKVVKYQTMLQDVDHVKSGFEHLE